MIDDPTGTPPPQGQQASTPPDPDSLYRQIVANRARSAQFPVGQAGSTQAVQSDDTSVAGPSLPDPDKLYAQIQARRGQISTLHGMSDVPMVGPVAELGARALESTDPTSMLGKLLGTDATIADQAARGASQGFAPKVAGALAAAGGGSYSKTRDAWKQRYADEDTAQPIASRAGDIGGTLATGAAMGEVLPAGLIGGAAEKVAPKLTQSMLARILTRGTMPAVESGALRATGETSGSPTDYETAIVNSLPASAATGTALGTVGQVAGTAAGAARAEPEVTGSPEFQRAMKMFGNDRSAQDAANARQLLQSLFSKPSMGESGATIALSTLLHNAPAGPAVVGGARVVNALARTPASTGAIAGGADDLSRAVASYLQRRKNGNASP